MVLLEGVREMRLELKGIGKDFDQEDGEMVSVLDGISLKVEDDQIVAILGPSGCGKTTLLRIIAGLDPASRGEVLLDGLRVERPSPRVGMIFQEHALLPWCSIIDNVCIGLEMRGVAREEAKEKAMLYLHMVGLEKVPDQRPHELSGGMRQRASVARALTMEPALLLMDEPFSALDPLTRKQIQEDILGIQEKAGKSIVMVTHSVDEALFLSTEIVVLSARPGRICRTMNIDLKRPREREGPGFLENKKEILSLLEGLARPLPERG
jgi:NitT/TauT family transport system ATP-binding protein